jgi:hypothetical protein
VSSGYMNPDHPERALYYINLPMHFFTGENGIAVQANRAYTVTHPREIIAAELSKKEKKKLGL